MSALVVRRPAGPVPVRRPPRARAAAAPLDARAAAPPGVRAAATPGVRAAIQPEVRAAAPPPGAHVAARRAGVRLATRLRSVRVPAPLRAIAIAARRSAARGLAASVLVALAAAVSGCATAPDGPSAGEALRARISAGDLAGADALIAARPAELDARRGLDFAIRDGRLDAVRHYVAQAGADAPLDVERTTPLIRAVVDAPPAARDDVVEVLLSAGADPSRADVYGRDARAWATARGRVDLLARLDGTAADERDRSTPALARWLGTAPPALAAAATPAAPGPGGVSVVAIAPGAVVPRGRAQPPVPVAPSPSELLRGSPWTAGDGAADHAALRFHADGTADLLRTRAGSGFEPVVPSGVAWSIADGRLRLTIVADAFVAGCAGVRADASADGAAGTRARPGALALGCEDLAPAARRTGGSPGVELARVLLSGFDVPRDASRPGAASGTDAAVALARRVAAPAIDAEPAPRMPVSLRASSGAPAACVPPRSRKRAPAPVPRGTGDWTVLDVRRLEAHAPTSGRTCTQARARDAAMRACRAAAGPGGAAACRSVGGCPPGRVSAVAGLAGVDNGWLACDADLDAARRRALAACRDAVGCDCQLLALSGRNLVPTACPAPARRR